MIRLGLLHFVAIVAPVYVQPVLEALGLVELEHNARNNRVRAR